MTSTASFIEIAGLSKTYNWGKIRALDNVNLSVHSGEVFGLIGPNGAGKTTLMGCLLAVLNPTSGQIKINGKPPDDLAVRKITGFLPERPHFDAWMKVGQFLQYHQMLSLQPSKNVKQEIEEALTAVGLDPSVSKRSVKQLSRGMLQRLGLAQVLIGKPQVCFLDEPTSGMDPLGMALVHDLVMQWKRQGVTVILNSHHLDEVAKVCDRVAFIKGGKIESIEELSLPSMTKLSFTVRWAQNLTADQSQQLPAIASAGSAQIEEAAEAWTRFSLIERSSALQLIRALVLAEFPLEEASLERKNLHDLFSTQSSEQAPP